MKQEPWNHETAQINLSRQRIVFGDDKDRLLPTLLFKAVDGQLKWNEHHVLVFGEISDIELQD